LDRKLLDDLFTWLGKQVSGIPEQDSVNKNFLQELLLGIGIIRRDIDFAVWTDLEETEFPDCIHQSKLDNFDSNKVSDMLRSLSAHIKSDR